MAAFCTAAHHIVMRWARKHTIGYAVNLKKGGVALTLCIPQTRKGLRKQANISDAQCTYWDRCLKTPHKIKVPKAAISLDYGSKPFYIRHCHVDQVHNMRGALFTAQGAITPAT